MAMDAVAEKYIPKDNSFFINYYRYFFYGLMGSLALILFMVSFVLYQVATRPLPKFQAKAADGSTMGLVPYEQPSLLPETIIRFASKAAVTAYTFDFVNYQSQLAQAKPFFTPAGWTVFYSSIGGLVGSIVERQLFVSGVVAGTPVISNQGPLPGKGYVWRVQLPFLVTYQSAGQSTQRRYFVSVSIIRVPTSVNPQGIGIDQFITR